ncbi:MAG: hypothetical protein HZB15_18400 [Actinobacteria bacterium]|nr:hypothetical protein [Actinomycetota bacterium]
MVSDFAGASVAATSSPMIHVNWKDADGRSVFYVATVDQAEFVENLRLGFASVSDVTVHGAPGFIRTIEGEPTYRGVVWHESGLTYQVGSQQLTTDELLALVEQMRAATSSEWAAMVATAGAEFPTPPDTTSAVTVADP